MMSSIVVGKSGTKTVSLDIDALLRGRMLVQANSGKGKSWLLRRLAEQLFGKVQVIIIDPEGEFATLREKYGYVLVGKGGETPADPRSAALVAHKLLELRASAVCDLYEMKPASRHEWVQNFLEAMIDAPKNLWHPCVVMVDEAHIYAPEKGAGESVAAEGMIGMATRGRKRGFVLLPATQRLGKLRKDLAAEMQTVMIGGTFIDIDRKRAAETLGVYDAELHKFFDEIRVLDSGYFFALGPAISNERILVQVGTVETSHPEAGSGKHAAGPPPAPEAIAKLLAKLSDLPKEAEEKAKTEKELRIEVRSLKAQLRSQPKAEQVDNPSLHRGCKAEIAALHAEAKALKAKGERIARTLQETASAAAAAFTVALRESHVVTTAPTFHKRLGVAPKPYVTPIVGTSEDGGELGGPHRRILQALAELRSIGKHQAPKPMVASWAGYAPGGGAFINPLGALRTMGLVEYPASGMVTLTEAGVNQAGDAEPPDQEDINRRVLDTLGGPARKILAVLIDIHGERISRSELAERTGYSEGGGAFINPLGALHTAGFVDYPERGFVKAADWLFFE